MTIALVFGCMTQLPGSLIIPMVLQFAKILIVDGDWIAVKLLPWVYFWEILGA